MDPMTTLRSALVRIKMKWISVKDRIPEEYEFVLIYQGDDIFIPNEKYAVARWVKSHTIKYGEPHKQQIKWIERWGKDDVFPTHWMPLEPPKENDNE